MINVKIDTYSLFSTELALKLSNKMGFIMKICFIAPGYAIHTLRWANFFAERGHDVHIVSSGFMGGYNDGITKHIFKNFMFGNVNKLYYLLQMKKILESINPEVIDGHYISVGGYLGAYANVHPFIITPWGSDVLIDPKKSFVNRFLIRESLKNADCIVYNSEMMKLELLKLGTDISKMEKILNGVDSKKFYKINNPKVDIKNKLNINDEDYVVISTRKFEPIYNVEMLIKAIPLITKHNENVTFIIAGGGEQKDYLINLANKLDILKHVRVLDWISHDELPYYLSISDIYVSTSTSDSASVSLQEAMSCELPVVVTDIPGNREWVMENENGFIVPINDYVELSKKIIFLFNDNSLRRNFGEKARKQIVSLADYNVQMEKSEQLYKKLIYSK